MMKIYTKTCFHNCVVTVYCIKIEKNCKGGGVSSWFYELLSYTNRNDLSMNFEALEFLPIEITNNKSKNLIFNIAYRQPDRDLNMCKKCFKNIPSKNVIRNKMWYLQEILTSMCCTLSKIKMPNILLTLYFSFGIIQF